MFVFICSLLLLSTCSILTIETKPTSSMTYVVIRDYFLLFKAPEYSIYNTSEKDLYYRIESNYDIQDNIKLVTYPSKQVIAKLRSKKRETPYEAKISICNTTDPKQWSHGMIIQHPQWFYTNYSIEWNGYHLSMISEIASWTTDILDPSQNHPLARIERFWLSRNFKYQLEISSNKVPESIYLLGLAVVSRGNNGLKKMVHLCFELK